jgi:DNA invertase Pin-like site-specific DNA recombinase
MRIGYARVSTDDQNLDLQQDALRQARVDKRYEDKASGKSLVDTLIVWRLDRLGRSVKDLVALINELGERGVEFVSLTKAIDTTTPMGSFIFYITAALAELSAQSSGSAPAPATHRPARADAKARGRRSLTTASSVLSARLWTLANSRSPRSPRSMA